MSRRSKHLAAILTQADAGVPADAIAGALDLTVGYVYTVLRRERPGRARKARRRTSDKVPLIVGLTARGYETERVAELALCTTAYVYRVLKQSR